MLLQLPGDTKIMDRLLACDKKRRKDKRRKLFQNVAKLCYDPLSHFQMLSIEPDSSVRLL